MRAIRFKGPARFNRTKVAIVLIVCGAIALSVVLAQMIADGFDPMFLLAGFVAAAGGLAVYKLGRFEYGLLLVLITAGFINFFTLPTGRDSRIVISLALSLVLLTIWGFQLLFRRSTGVRVQPSPINKPVLAFVLVVLIGYVWSLFMRDPILKIWSSFPMVQVASLIVNISLPLVALMTANKITEVKWLKWLSLIVIAIGITELLSRFLNLPTLILVSNGTRGMFTVWLGGILYAQALFNNRLSLVRRAMLLGLLAALIYQRLIVDTSWVSGWLPLALVCAIITFVRSRKLFAVLCVLALIVVALKWDYVMTSYEAEMAGGSNLRGGLWAKAFGYVLQHPLFGMGPAGYAVYYMTYQPNDAMATHNNLFDVIAQHGFIGIVAFLWMFGVFFVVTFRSMRLHKGRGDFVEAFSVLGFAGAVASFAGMMLGDWLLPFAYTQTISGFDNAVFTWMFIGCAVALYHMRLRANVETKPQAALPATPVSSVQELRSHA